MTAIDPNPLTAANLAEAFAGREGPFRFVWRRPGGDIVVEVPRRYPDQGIWPNGLPRQVIEQDNAARDRAIQRHADRVARETRGGARGGSTETGRPEHPKVDARRVRALLLDRGALDHHEVGAAIGVTPAAAAHVLTHLRNTGHIHRAATRKRARTNPKDCHAEREVGVWELTAQGRAATKREQRTGKKLTTYNDSGYRSSGAP